MDGGAAVEVDDGQLVGEVRLVGAVDELAARLAKRVAGLRAGDPRDPAVQVGPLIAPAEAERAERWIQQAAGRGAAVLVGGERDGPVLAPALLRDPPLDSRIMTEEIFAPAVALAAVASLDEAIDLVNAVLVAQPLRRAALGLAGPLQDADIDALVATALDIFVQRYGQRRTVKGSR